MRPPALFVTIALVVSGLWIYDTFRWSSEEPGPRREPPPKGPPETVGPAEAAELGGQDLDGLRAALGRLEGRVILLEQRLARVATPVASSSRVSEPPPAPSPAPGPPPPAPSEWSPPQDPAAETFADQDVAWFRALEAEARRREAVEREAAAVARDLDRIGIPFDVPTRRSMERLATSFRLRLQEAGEAAARAPNPMEAKQSSVERLREEFAVEVRSLLPPRDAERVLEQMGEFPGFVTQRPGGR